MCIGVPAQVKTVSGLTAMAEIAGGERSINVMLIDDLKGGDWVIIHAGYAISKVDEASAQETLRDIAQITGFAPEASV